MNISEIEGRALRVANKSLGITINNIHTKFSDMDMDSLDAVELIMAWEDEFNIEITDNEMQRVTNLEQAYMMLKEKIGV